MKLLCKLTACCLLIMAYSCSEPSLVGEELLEDTIPFNALRTDTVTVKLTTVKPDWIQTNGLGNYLMGQIVDEPDFGSTKASIFTQTRLARNDIRISNDEIYDSLVLQLAYNFHYGDTLGKQTIKVFELSNNLCDPDTCNYYQNDKINSFPDPVGELTDYQHQFSGSIALKNLVFSSADSTSISEDIVPSHLRIKISDTIGQRLFNVFPDPDSEKLIDYKLFLDTLKGFHIDIDENTSDDNLMVSYTLQTNTSSKMVLYYHSEEQDYIYTDSLKTDSVLVSTTYNHKTIDFSIQNATSFNQIRNDYKGNALAALNSRPGEEGDELAYIQAGGALHVKVEFPYIKNGDLDNVLINKATLILHQVPSVNSIYNPLALINMYDAELYNDGFYSNIDEFEARSLLDTINWQHTFNFPALLQNILECENVEDTIKCENSEEIILVPANNSFTVSRAILVGDTDDDLENGKDRM